VFKNSLEREISNKSAAISLWNPVFKYALAVYPIINHSSGELCSPAPHQHLRLHLLAKNVYFSFKILADTALVICQ
jgi:hypothetical protein